MTKAKLKDLVYQVNGAAIEVHKHLGPGLLESVYHKCLMHELDLRGIKYHSEMIVPVVYKGLSMMTDFRCDLFIENILVTELKSAEKVLPIHEAILISYMKLLGSPMGLMLNFKCTHLFSEGQKTYVNDLYRAMD
ncbi:MAG: GxxExxY protein [Chitinophagaceae bacterium]